MFYLRMLTIAIATCFFSQSSWLLAAEPAPTTPVKSPTSILPLELPKELRPLPEPLPEGKQPGFKFRGIVSVSGGDSTASQSS